MRRKQLLFSLVLLAVVLSVALNGCSKKDNGPSNLTLVSLKAGDIDLNGVTAPSNVPANPTITATFNESVDPTTATNANITLVRTYDTASIPLTISVSGAVVTITSTGGNLGTGAAFKLSVNTSVKSTGNLVLTAQLDRTFTTLGSFVPTGQIAYWNFENQVNDQVGSYNPMDGGVIDLTYAASHTTAAGQAGLFNGTTTLVRIPNGDILMNQSDFSLSFWVMADSTKHGQFVMGLAGAKGFQFEITGDYSWCKLAAQYKYADGTSSGSEDIYFPGNGQTKDNGGWMGWTFCKDLTNSGGVQALIANQWAHIICTFNHTTELGTMYINGAMMKQQDFHLWPAGDPKQTAIGLKYAGKPAGNVFVFGFIQDKENLTLSDAWADYSVTTNNHFKGLLDDVRIYNRALSAAEVKLSYNSEKQ
jgi:hypothetical protein